jgi:hypothetical protein
MIDIYRRLGATGPGDRAQIERALNDPHLAPDLRQRACFILGDLDRRRTHDATWRAATVVARLRSAFLLEMTPLWRGSDMADFGAGTVDSRRTTECLPIDALDDRVHR